MERDLRAHVGSFVEILPAYNSESGERDLYDASAGCLGWVREDAGSDLLVEIKVAGSWRDVWLSRARCTVVA